MSDKQQTEQQPDRLNRPGGGTASRLIAFGVGLLGLGAVTFGYWQFQYYKLISYYHGNVSRAELDFGYVSFHFRRMGLGIMAVSVAVIFVGLLYRESRSTRPLRNRPSFEDESTAKSKFDFLAGHSPLEESEEP